MFLDGYQFNNKNAHMAQKEIILYGKITFYVIFYPGRICIFSKKRTLLFTKSIFFVWKPTIHFITKMKKVAIQYKHKQQNTNFLFPAFSKESSLNYDQGNRTQEE